MLPWTALFLVAALAVGAWGFATVVNAAHNVAATLRAH